MTDKTCKHATENLTGSSDLLNNGWNPNMDEAPYLHFWGHYTYHAEARIVGNRGGLRTLYKAIGAALETGRGKSEAFASDGEGYAIEVHRAALIADLGDPPYLDQMAREIADRERQFLRHNNKSYDAWLADANKRKIAEVLIKDGWQCTPPSEQAG